MLAPLLAITLAAAAQAAPSQCNAPDECSALALQARSRGAYETFHDLAWRAVQTGKPDDPELMYLLARAQALSGRRRDALIMLRRLAESGGAGNAAAEDDFRRVRELPGWGEVSALIARRTEAAPGRPPAAPPRAADDPAALPVAPSAPARAGRPAAAPVPPALPAAPAVPPAAAPPAPAAGAPPAPAAPPPPASPPAPTAMRVEPGLVEEAARFAAPPFVPAGFAYDGVSRRFLFGDAAGRRVFVVGEGSDRPIDLARAENTGFAQVSAFAIDRARGTLWVASAGPEGRGATLHQLQLISGREVASIPMAADGAVRLRDMAVAANGGVFLLDDVSPQVLLLRSAGKAVEGLVALAVTAPTSVTVADGGRIAYVSHAAGLLRIDLQAQTSSDVNAPAGVTLADFDWIRWHRESLVGLQRQPDGSRALVRLRLARGGQRVSEAVLMDSTAAADSVSPPPTVVGDDLYYALVSPSTPTSVTIVVRRVRLSQRQ